MPPAHPDGRERWYLHDEKYRRQYVWSSSAGLCWLTSSLPATVDDLDRILGVNLRGTFLCYKYAGKQMIAQGRGGRIIGDPPILTALYCVTHP